jgi:hypothetical protein
MVGMSKLTSKKIDMTFEEFEARGLTIADCKWKLVRERDNLTRYSLDVKWVEWDKTGLSFVDDHPDIAVGLSLIMSPFNHFYVWLTTTVTEIVEQTDSYVKFKTENSNYKLEKINRE